MFNPRTDFTNLLYLDIHIKKLFDIQVCTFGIASYINGITGGESMYVIIGSHFVPLESKCLLIALVNVRITLNMIVGQMLLNIC
jgi:hypothetical protein